MVKTIIAEIDLCPLGHPQFSNLKSVFRINLGDRVVFKIRRSIQRPLFIVNISSCVEFDILSNLEPSDYTTSFLFSSPWIPPSPGPYRIRSVDECPDDSIVASTIVVNSTTRIEDIRMLTVMPRRLGPMADWPSVLSRAVIDKNYNAIHFTPMQKLGPSNSSYSIADVLDIDDQLVSHPSADSKYELLKSVLKSIPNSPLVFTDIVLNHAASSDSWATKCPEATYCVRDCPYLTCALELDLKLEEIISNWTGDVSECIHSIRVFLEKFNFSQYCQLDIAKTVDLFRSSSTVPVSTTDPWWQVLCQIGTSRTEKIIVDFRNFCVSESELWKQINSFSTRLETLATEFVNESFSALESTIRYNSQFLPHQPLLSRYFSRMAHGDYAVNNGWVMNWPAGIDFASPGHHLVFMKRHVVAWGDCVKLRYDAENPIIWKVMERYCEKIASIFDGVRLDNCHSTPLFVLKRLVSVMRRTNPNILIMAELFTGEANNDSVFEASIGIDLLVREGMQIHKGEEIVEKLWGVSGHLIGGGSISSAIPQCILYDSTHDNSTVFEKLGDWRTALPFATAVAFSPSAIGSSVGFDTIAHQMPSVVVPRVVRDDHLLGIDNREKQDEKIYLPVFVVGRDVFDVKVFGDWDDWTHGIPLVLNSSIWVLEDLPENISIGKTQYKFVINQTDWMCSPFVGLDGTGNNNVVGTVGTLNEFKSVLNSLHEKMNSDFADFFAKSRDGIVEIRRMNRNTMACVIALISFDKPDDSILIDLDTPFEAIEFAYSMRLGSNQLTVIDLKMTLSENGMRIRIEDFPSFSVLVFRTSVWKNWDVTFNQPPLDELVNPQDFSHVLFRCDSEEPSYEIPGYGKLVYAGLAGISSLVESFSNDSEFLGSPLADNIRQGDWLFDYCTNRLSVYSKLHNWLSSVVRPIYSELPIGMKPKYFVQIFVRQLHALVIEKLACFHGPNDVTTSFSSLLTIATFQFTAGPTVAAGLPFFSSGYMRCWGRDTFISFSGLFLVTRRFEDARRTILDFARVVRHGLIPNLYDDGLNPRYNARDACWFFLHAICQYIEVSGDEEILDQTVDLKYYEAAFTYRTSPRVRLVEVVRGILLSHYEGIDFVEWNAGPHIDAHMKPEGFHVTVYVDKTNGLVLGGNQWNCGTWMDKMGSAWMNKGVPATPRYGGAIEINGIALRVLDFFVGRLGDIELVSWHTLLREHFGAMFFVDGMVKDVVRGDPVEETRFRPNACIALATIPLDAVDRDAACVYLKKCDESLRGPLGMRTLPSTDPAYNGVYDNSDESAGYNYHNGPEWVWLFGFFLIACNRFNVFTPDQMMEMVEQHELHIRRDRWRSLPELTNINGHHCPFSCPAQAWSVCCLLEAISKFRK